MTGTYLTKSPEYIFPTDEMLRAYRDKHDLSELFVNVYPGREGGSYGVWNRTRVAASIMMAGPQKPAYRLHVRFKRPYEIGNLLSQKGF